MTSRLGISISTLNRREIFNDTLSSYQKFSPSESPIVVVDDGSDIPVPPTSGVTVLRNKTSQGVSSAKNRGIAVLMDMGCDYIVLSDDDCHPVGDGWERGYIESGEDHLSHQPIKIDWCVACRRWTHWAYYVRMRRFTCESHEPPVEIFRDDKIRAVEWGAGVMLYLTRRAVEKAGGMRPEFGRWSSEHFEYAHRLCNLGLCRFPFQDVHNPKLWARDAYTTGRRSCISDEVKNQHRHRNWELFQKYKGSTDFVPFQQGGNV